MDPSVGYFDANNSVCNFMEQWKGFDYTDQLQDVPLEKLVSTAPQAYVFEGGPWTMFCAIISREGWLHISCRSPTRRTWVVARTRSEY